MSRSVKSRAKESAAILGYVAFGGAVIAGGPAMKSARGAVTGYTFTLPSTPITLDSSADPFQSATPFGSYLADLFPSPAVAAYSRIVGINVNGVTFTAANGALLSDFRVGLAGVSRDANTGYDFNSVSPLRISTSATAGSIVVTGGLNFTTTPSLSPLYVKANSHLGIVAYNSRAPNISATPFAAGMMQMSGGSITFFVDPDLTRLAPAASAPVPAGTRITLPTSQPDVTTFGVSNLSAGGISWFRLNYNGGRLSIDTAGSNLTDGTNVAVGSDTHVALYDAHGNVVGENNDLDVIAGTYSSSLTFLDGNIPRGTYFLAVTGYADQTGFNDFSNGFHAASASSYHGTINVNVNVTGGAISVPGDYNGDGFVDSADYTVWADNFGKTGVDVPGDGNADDIVNAADYTIWADNFGQGTPPPGLAAAVPEPAKTTTFATIAAAMLRRRRRR